MYAHANTHYTCLVTLICASGYQGHEQLETVRMSPRNYVRPVATNHTQLERYRELENSACAMQTADWVA